MAQVTDGAAWPAMSFDEVQRLLSAPGAPFEMTEASVLGRPVRTFVNSPLTLRDSLVAGRRHGEAVFLVHGDERVTFEAFARAVLALAARLEADGVRKGDRVAIALRNLPEWGVAFFAATIIGAIATPLNAWWTGEELRFALQDSDARALVADPERLDRLGGAAGPDGLERIYSVRDPETARHPGATPLEGVIGPPEAWGRLPAGDKPRSALSPEDDATLFYTSGTSGHPKGVLGSHRNNGAAILALAWSAASAALRRGEGLEKLTAGPQGSALVSIPFFHTTGCQALLVPAFVVGTKLVLMHRFDPEVALQLIEAEGVTTAGGVPAIAWQMFQHADRDRHDLSSLETVAFGGAPAAPELLERIRAGAPHALPATGWGMTETSAVTTHHMGEDYLRHPESCGRAIPVCDLKIIDAAGRPLPVGEVGELCVRGPNVAKGYWNRPLEEAATFVDGWVRTGDIARIDDEGFCYIVDRAKDLIIRGGENIASIEVENVLFAHPAVADVAVVGLSDQVLGEVPAAAIVLTPGATLDEDDLKRFCAERLAGFKVPVRILASTDPLPRNAAGKLLKPSIRALFAA